ncbi:MULE domain-containing protein [Aphis craccivora]|uniref:MULE domain-containing protein n=1 Tax=Aphis craccivora TaxID=307492 RepID=A0A6G0Y8G3_APHCR|nr:MULE domain-containing protein [Aphis craccivora]
MIHDNIYFVKCTDNLLFILLNLKRHIALSRKPDRTYYTIKNTIKRKASEEISMSPNKIIRKAISDADHVTVNDISNYRQNIYIKRWEVLLVLPKSYDEAISQLMSSQETLITFKKEKFIFIDNNKIVLLTCETNLKTLCENAEHILADRDLDIVQNIFINCTLFKFIKTFHYLTSVQCK